MHTPRLLEEDVHSMDLNWTRFSSLFPLFRSSKRTVAEVRTNPYNATIGTPAIPTLHHHAVVVIGLNSILPSLCCLQSVEERVESSLPIGNIRDLRPSMSLYVRNHFPSCTIRTYRSHLYWIRYLDCAQLHWILWCIPQQYVYCCPESIHYCLPSNIMANSIHVLPIE